MVLPQTMKNGEGATGIRNRPLRERGGVFSSLKRRGGVPSGAAQVIAIAGLALPEITGIVQFNMKMELRFHLVCLWPFGIISVFIGKPTFQQIAYHQ